MSLQFTWFLYRLSISNCSKVQNFFSTCIKTLIDNPISDPVRQAGQRTISILQNSHQAVCEGYMKYEQTSCSGLGPIPKHSTMYSYIPESENQTEILKHFWPQVFQIRDSQPIQQLNLKLLGLSLSRPFNWRLIYFCMSSMQQGD